MSESIKILVVEDEVTNSLLLKRLLIKNGYSVLVANSGADAIKLLKQEPFDVMLVDWMMPEMDGIELIKNTRQFLIQLPLIIMVTALVSESARTFALESGADDFVSKPIELNELLNRINDGINKKEQIFKLEKKDIEVILENNLPEMTAVAVATSTGGPPALINLFHDLNEIGNTAFFVVQHGPTWMLETFSQRLQRETSLKVIIATQGMQIEAKNIYLAPGDVHLKVNPQNFTLILDDGPKENFVKPSADPLFRSIADAFGKFSIGVILTGLGKDGAQGAMQIASKGGLLLVQDPKSAIAPSMPQTVIDANIPHILIPLENLNSVLKESISLINSQLQNLKK